MLIQLIRPRAEDKMFYTIPKLKTYMLRNNMRLNDKRFSRETLVATQKFCWDRSLLRSTKLRHNLTVRDNLVARAEMKALDNVITMKAVN